MIADQIRELLPDGDFAPPCDLKQITAVEKELGIELPSLLRDLYLAFNGFREPKGKAQYLLQLTSDGGGDSLLSTTQFYWNEWPEQVPGVDLKPFVFFGLSSGDENWAMKIGSSDVIAYHHHMEDTWVDAGEDLVDIYRQDQESHGGAEGGFI